MAPEELTHRLAELEAQKRVTRAPDLLRRTFWVLLAGVCGELGCIVGLYLVAGRSHIGVVVVGLLVGPFSGFFPGMVVGLYCARALHGSKPYVGLFLAALTGIGLGPVAGGILILWLLDGVFRILF
jgi:hypothetical protein